MTDFHKAVQKIGLAVLFTLLNYFIISNFIIELSFVRYFIVELVLVFSYKFYSFTLSSLNLQDNNEQ
jgi:hypothetical protein